MSEIIRMVTAEPILYGVVKIVWEDGYEAAVDLRPVIAKGEMFAFLRSSPERFAAVRRDQHGHTIYWLDDDGDEIEFGTLALRRRAKAQDELHRLAG